MLKRWLKNLLDTRKSVKVVRDLAMLSEHLAQPAIQLRACEKVSRSHFGGAPHLPNDFVWPARNGKKLAFLTRVSLGDLAKVHRISWLPAKGALVFFYDVQEQPWGFDPSDRSGWAVALVPDISAAVAAKQNISSFGNAIAPKTFLFGLLTLSRSKNLEPQDSGMAINFMPVSLHKIALLPNVESPAVKALSLNNVEWEAYNELRAQVYDEQAAHQISGSPSPIQGEMELECQLASHGIHCGKTDPAESKRTKGLEKGAKTGGCYCKSKMMTSSV